MTSLIGCAVGPNYKRPTVEVPVTYRGVASDSSSSDSSTGADAQSQQQKTNQQATPSFGDEKWWDVFQDRELQNLVRTALKNNYDVRIAATRVLEAQAQLGITRANQLPTLSGGGNIASQQSPKLGPIPSYELTQGQVELLRPGIWISGESIAVRRKLRAPICWPTNGRRKR
jgi:multidrug efflux system outer membrane protein